MSVLVSWLLVSSGFWHVCTEPGPQLARAAAAGYNAHLPNALHGRIYLPIFFARPTFLADLLRIVWRTCEPFLTLSSSQTFHAASTDVTADFAANAPPATAFAKADAIEVTVTGLGYDLVEVERLPRGLLRVTIDRLPGRVYGTPGAPDTGEFITVDDCERVTRQLQLSLEVAGTAYERLEVSSPGLDRLLKTEAHCHRFAGQAVKLTLKMPFQTRKHWTGILVSCDPAPGWRLEVTEGKEQLALDFQFDEAREIRLVPVVDFKGRRSGPAKNQETAAAAPLNGEQEL